jgi:hypothetical protein
MAKYSIMAHYKTTEKDQGHVLPVQYSEQILPGTYEHDLQRLVDENLDLGVFDRKYRNDLTVAAGSRTPLENRSAYAWLKPV